MTDSHFHGQTVSLFYVTVILLALEELIIISTNQMMRNQNIYMDTDEQFNNILALIFYILDMQE